MTFVLLSVTLSASAQLVMKYGMSRPAVQTALEGGDLFKILWTVGTSVGVVGGLSLYVGSMVFWLWVLSKIEVSKAYPFVSLGFLIIMVFSYFFLGESLSPQKLIGTLLVVAGVVLVARV